VTVEQLSRVEKYGISKVGSTLLHNIGFGIAILELAILELAILEMAILELAIQELATLELHWLFRKWPMHSRISMNSCRAGII
jgi:hypothetical protein